ncbi:hypothetical protein [Enhygromyxa salina]|uniref:hypothetical protein n=1 Tax=Enhygromyxa salina TaxID=215803 RepID=UPI0011B25319|nr:hypothetical protein [Enhygromyxa salina]
MTAPIHVAQAAPSFEDLYTQGQEKFDGGDYGAAGDLWAQAVRTLPESPSNSATRQTLMNVALDAYLRAYRGDQDRSHIDDAKLLLDEYEASLESAGTELTSEIASEKGKIEDILAKLAAAEEPEDKPEEKPEEKPNDEPVEVFVDENPGRGLVIGGGVMIGVGAAGAGLLVAGLVLGGSAQKDFDAAAPFSTERDAARKSGRTMNALAVTGGIVAPVFLGAGIALLVIGLQRNKAARLRNVSVLPNVAPGYAGLGFSGTF